MHTIDTHSHFNLSQFDTDREEAIARMKDASIGTICVGIDEETSGFALELAHEHEGIWACVGQHPTEWSKEFDDEIFFVLANEEKVVAIGECGLDYFREDERAHKDEQRVLFRKQIELSIETNLPLMLHIRPQQGTMDAYIDALLILKEYKEKHPTLRGTAHFFVGTIKIAQQFLDLGFHISFSGVITIFPEYEEVVRYVPLDRILAETDAPFAAPVPYRGKRNEPVYVTEIVKKIAQLKGIQVEETQAQILKNSQELFRLQTL
jgi:TatD DNase family protein